jgi:hypothetical protein
MPLQEERNFLWDALYPPPDVHHYLQRRTADAIAGGEEPPYGCLMLRVVFMLHQQTLVLLIHQLKRVQGKINLGRHIARMAEVCHFLRYCNIFCSVVIFELHVIVIVL